MDVKFWRRWHRWIGFPAALFLCWAASTGFLVAFTEFFGEAEALREATRDLVSPVQSGASADVTTGPILRALAAVSAKTGSVPVDKIEFQTKGDHPTVTIFTGKRTGGEDRKFVVDAATGAILKEESYADKPLLYRLHSGEAFGDGGLVAAMFWALALVVLTLTGLLIYWTMRRKAATGLQRVFW